MARSNRSGGKFTGNHTTLVPAASIIADIAEACESVYRISPGFIKAGLKPVGGQKRVKITDSTGYILLAVRDNTSNQEIHVYADNTKRVIEVITQEALGAGFKISFKKS